jgi:hypothetical protein
VYVEAIQSRVLLCKHATVKQRERKCRSFVKAKVFVPFRKCDRHDVLEVSVVRLGWAIFTGWLKPRCVESLVLNSNERWLGFAPEKVTLPWHTGHSVHPFSESTEMLSGTRLVSYSS